MDQTNPPKINFSTLNIKYDTFVIHNSTNNKKMNQINNATTKNTYKITKIISQQFNQKKQALDLSILVFTQPGMMIGVVC